jgi:ADP-ribosylglycohydrolase
MSRDFIKDELLGVAVGDAIGVPVEFKSRGYLREHPVTGVQGYGTHFQPEGTWSDDSSLALSNGVSPELAGGVHEDSNGNGSLMRILPLLFLVRREDIHTRFQLIKEVSSLTHRHIRSVVGCFIYLEVALRAMGGNEKITGYQQACTVSRAFLHESGVCPNDERGYFERILSGTIFTLPEEKIWSSGYVIHTLEAALWCFLTTENYRDAVLKAVNLGEDTDTTAAVTGGLAALYYGWQTIPADWLKPLARLDDIEELCRRLNKKFEENG